MKGYEALKNKTPHQNQDVEGSYSENNFAGHLKQTDVNLHNVHIMKLFLGSLPQENWHIVVQQNQSSLMMK